MIRQRLACLLASLATTGLAGAHSITARAAEIVVTTTAWKGVSECTLRDAIAAANADLPAGGCPAGSGADTIVLAPGATYFLEAVDNSTGENGPNGLPSITSAVTITGNGTTIARGIPNSPPPSRGGTPAFRFLHVAPSSVLALSGLTLTGGLAPADVNTQKTIFSGGNGGAIFNEGTLVLTRVQVIANEAAAGGGGIYNAAGATLTLTESSVSGNRSDECSMTHGFCPGISGRQIPGGGGGITNDGIMTANSTVWSGNFGGEGGAIRSIGTMALDQCTVSDNEASGNAGGLDNLGSATVTHSTFARNVSDDYDSGAIWNEPRAILSMTNCVLAENMALDGGGISNYGTATLTDCTLRDNVANSGGGFAGAIGSYGGSMQLRGCAITGNFATAGGGIANSVNSTMTVANCTLNNNSAGDGAGGGLSNGGNLTMTNCTISGNTSVEGGAGIDYDDSFGGMTTIENCIIADNASILGPGNCTRPILRSEHNLSTDDTCGSSPDLVVADAGLAPLGSYGGLTQTIALCTAAGIPDASCTGPSPALDAGDPELCAFPPVNGRDQRGFARPGMGHTRCSLGAFEADAIPALVCVGDCSGTATVGISDLVTLVNIALGGALPAACAYGVPSGSDVSVALIVQAVGNALAGCPLG